MKETLNKKMSCLLLKCAEWSVKLANNTVCFYPFYEPKQPKELENININKTIVK